MASIDGSSSSTQTQQICTQHRSSESDGRRSKSSSTSSLVVLRPVQKYAHTNKAHACQNGFPDGERKRERVRERGRSAPVRPCENTLFKQFIHFSSSRHFTFLFIDHFTHQPTLLSACTYRSLTIPSRERKSFCPRNGTNERTRCNSRG